jgi:hypothetical protein
MKRKILNEKVSIRLSDALRDDLRRQADISVCHEAELCRRGISMLLAELKQNPDMRQYGG